MRRIQILSTLAAAQLTLASAASGATLATGLMFWDDGAVQTACFVTNVGSKPVTITAATLQDLESTAIPPVNDDCTTAPLAPGKTCIFDSADTSFGGARIEGKGSAKSLRGRCVLRAAGIGDVVGSTAELR